MAWPADRDAAWMAGGCAAGAPIVGKTNLHELAFGASGVNDWFGTPDNPLDPRLVPGGSSSGSAVAVADGEADVARGSDTDGSMGVPAAFCGIVGLKTTKGRVLLAGGVAAGTEPGHVGPTARDVAGATAGMALLEPAFRVSHEPAVRVGRLRPADVDVRRPGARTGPGSGQHSRRPPRCQPGGSRRPEPSRRAGMTP